MSFLFRSRVLVFSLLAIALLIVPLSSHVAAAPVKVSASTSADDKTPVKAATPTAAEGKTKKPEKTFDERRIEALLKAKIDRSLPTVLKAWSDKKEPEKEDAKKAEKKDKSLVAKVVNIYEDFVILEFEKKPTFAKDESIEVRLEDKLFGTVKILSVEDMKVSGKFQAPIEEAKPEIEKAEKVKAEEVKAEEEPAKQVAPEAGEKTDEETDKPETASDAPAKENTAESKAAEAPAAQATPNTWDGLKNGSTVAVKKPDDGSAKKAQEEAQIKSEVAKWSKIVTLGKWTEVKTFLTTLKEEDADKLYAHLLTKLAAVPGAKEKQGSSRSRNEREKPLSNFLSPEDILQVADAAPRPWKISITGNKKFKGLANQVAGKWKGKITPEGDGVPAGAVMPDVEVTLDIQLNGTAVSGTIEVSSTGEGYVVEIDEGGQYAPESGSLTFKATKDGSTMSANLTVNEGAMTGTMSADEGGGGVTMRFEGELVEPAEQPASDDEDSEAEEEAADAKTPDTKSEIADAEAGDAKKKPSKGISHIPTLARLVKKSKTEGFDFSSYIEAIKQGASGIGGEEKDQKIIAADLFLKAGMSDEVEQFLPPLADAIKEEDVVSMKLWSQLSIKKYRSKQIAKWLNSAWDANMALSSIEKFEQKEKDAAMANLIELSPKVDREIGEKWLDESFTQSPERGMKILTNLGTKSSTMARQAAQVSESERLKLLRLQNGAAEKLLKVSPELANEWADALTLLADTWLKEADIAIQYGSSNSGGGYWDYCLLYTSPSPRDATLSRMPSSA